jgi:hypothetical protein
MVAQNRIPYRKPPGSNILRFDLDEIIAWTKAGNNKRREILEVLPCGHSLWWLQPQGERMSIFKVKNKNGTISYGYYFRDRVTKERYRKIVPLARTKWDAEQAEIKAKQEIFDK